jgi:putative hydrolase of the HAD superfamily
MSRKLTALVVDYGGVLTNSLRDTMGAWMEADRIDPVRYRAVMREWLSDGAESNLAHELERGNISAADFERQFAAVLAREDGSIPDPEGLLRRMFAGFRTEDGMIGVVRRARAAGVKTALLSNSWGNTYDQDQLAELFDVAVISGEVGMRKPEPEIYRLTARRLGVEPAECVFVDDLTPNVRGAVAVGMVGVHHVDTETTRGELEALFDVPLGPPNAAPHGERPA